MNTKCEVKYLPCVYLLTSGIDAFPKYSEGLFFARTKDGYRDGFFDIEGNLKISLSKYDLVWGSYSSVTGKNDIRFEDGKCTLLTRNEGGSIYKMVIDKTGAIIGEPEKVNVEG